MAGYTKEERKRLEAKWRAYWDDHNTYKTNEDPGKPKCYILDMFPYPSGAGLHVGHPLGYIASDIVARYQRMKGFNVLHPIGFDTFGLPAEQYAIDHGIPPKVSTEKNIQNFRVQLSRMALSYDWDREVQTCDPAYYKWTQWIFLQMFKSWFNPAKKKAEPIAALVRRLAEKGNIDDPFPDSLQQGEEDQKSSFSAAQWNAYTDAEQQRVLMRYRLAYLAYTHVNWCEELGTVLANDEVINGVSYRGGHPVVKKKMRQWHLRITAYAERLLEGLEQVDFSRSMKETQRNWIGKSAGVEIVFDVIGKGSAERIRVFTTRPDTLFGVDFLTLAPEHDLIDRIVTPAQKAEVEAYRRYVEGRSEVERMAEVKKITGCFTGAYARHPLSKKKIPIWVSEYVLIGYGTGAIMAVPCGDERDHRFAKRFDLPITNIIGSHYDGKAANPTYEAILENSDFLNGMKMRDAIPKVTERLEKEGKGKRRINYKMRDAGWSRQRYWGEPFPVVYRKETPYAMEEKDLPLTLPDTDRFTSPGTGEGPLAQLRDWVNIGPDQRRDTNTMPTHAGASWYFLRFTDPHNKTRFADPQKLRYWNQVDLYIGGAEHAVAHLLYARLVVKVLYDLNYLTFDEPFKKLVNQGKIMGNSRFVYRIKGANTFVSKGLKAQYETDALRVDVSLVHEGKLNIPAFKKWRPDFAHAKFILEEGAYRCGTAVEKMSKSYFNVINPDRIIDDYGADTLRMYEMFLGPLEQSKPWSASGIEGVHKFLKKFWDLCHDKNGSWNVSDQPPTDEEYRILHKTLKKIEWDINHFSFNTSVSEYMICVNQLTAKKCNKRTVLEPLTAALSPFAPHITEEIWQKLGHTQSIAYASYPKYEERYLKEDSFTYPVSVNGKVRAKINFPLVKPSKEMEKTVLATAAIKKWIGQKNPKKIIIVQGKIINVVV